jgi:hypothetical protein
LGRRQGDLTVLQEVAPLPKLGTANAFMPQRIHEIRRSGAGEAVLASSEGRIIPLRKLKAKSGESRGDPGVNPAIRFTPLTGWMRPDQGVGQAATMQNSASSTRASDHFQASASYQIEPMTGPGSLMAPE